MYLRDNHHKPTKLSELPKESRTGTVELVKRIRMK